MQYDSTVQVCIMFNVLVVPSCGQNKTFDFDVSTPFASLSAQRVHFPSPALACVHFALLIFAVLERVSFAALCDCLQLYWQPALQQVQRLLVSEWEVLQR
jgi:hypothetical protein